MTKQTILLIQSVHTAGNGTKSHLEKRGYNVIRAGSGLTALMVARNEAIDLIVLDAALPDIEGLDLCRRFRARQDTHSIPIILLTGRWDEPQRMAVKPYGPDDCLTKPYAERELEDLIVKVLHAGKDATANEAEPQQGPGLSQEPSLPQEPRPALITVMQQAPKPDLKLVPKMEPEPGVEPSQAAAVKREMKPEEGGERRPVLRAVRRPDLKVVPKPESELESESASQAESGTPRKPEAEPLIPQEPAPVPELSAGPTSENTPPPILSFRGAGNAVIDPATGLFGRPQFEAMFSKEFKRAARFKQQMSCMLINLDGQKMGRRAGDALVKAIIGLVQKTIREVDTAAWWSGEALIVLLPNTMRHDALQAAVRILDAVANHPFTWPDSTNVTMSIGVAGLPDKNIDTEQKLIEEADLMCRRAQELMMPPPFDVRTIKR